MIPITIQTEEMQAAIDLEIHACVDILLSDYPREYISIFDYQLGWSGERSGKDAQGKRIRPLLLLLACHAFGGDWRKALPAAAAVELVHNFSLIHDDIQDCSDTRRGRPTVWVKWGNAQAINAGDSMLTVAQLSILRLASYFDPKKVNMAVEMLQYACLQLTRGQHLDIAYEEKEYLPLELYWQMIEGKTSALISACLKIGALLAGAEDDAIRKMGIFGSKIGAAFQVQDDWLGIWGNGEVTGKSCVSDLMSKKKTYPVLLGITNNGKFFETWKVLKKVNRENAQHLAKLLKDEKLDLETKMKFKQLYREGFDVYSGLNFEPEKSFMLRELVESLFDRIK